MRIVRFSAMSSTSLGVTRGRGSVKPSSGTFDARENRAMKLKLKNLKEQVIVITGASSGIGLATARLAAEKGAIVVATAREETALSELTDELKKNGCRCAYVVADVAKEDDVRKIASVALQEFGRIDTWVNNAGV